MKEEKKFFYLFVILLVGATAFRLLYIAFGPLDLSGDEAHYWEWSRRLDGSYYSKGPLVAYIIYIFAGWGPTTEFMVRLPAVLLSSGALVLLYLLALNLFASPRIAFLTGLMALVVPLFSAGSLLMTIDAPFLFFWVLGCLLVVKALGPALIQEVPIRGEGRVHSSKLLTLNSQLLNFRESLHSTPEGKRTGWWLATGGALGLGFLAKYTMLLFIPSLLMFLLSSPRCRHWLKRPEPYLGLLLALALASPVLLWNAAHGWVSVKHVLGQGGMQPDVAFSLKSFGQFLGSQAGVISPFLFLLLIWAIIWAFWLGFKRERGNYHFLFWMSLPTLVIFSLLSFKAKVQANWPAAAYPAAILTLAALICQGFPGKRWTTLGLGLALAVALAMSAAGHYTDPLYRLNPGWNVKKDPTNRLRGWQELGLKVGQVVGQDQGRGMFIFSDRYQLTSLLAFYVPGQPVTYNVNVGRRMNQYDLWGGWEKLQGKDGLYVKSGPDTLEPQVAQAFANCQRLEPVEIRRLGKLIKSFELFRCQAFQGFQGPPRRERY